MATFEVLTGIWLDQELHSADSTALFTTARRAQAVNDGVAEFADLTECLIRVSTVTVSCNVSRYNLLSSSVLGSTDFVRIAARGVEFHLTSSNGLLTQRSGDGFLRRDTEWLNHYQEGWRQSTTPTDPTGWLVDESSGQYVIQLDVPPDVGSSESAQLVIPYVARPVVMTSSGEVPFTVGSAVRTDLLPFHLGLVHYAAHQLEKLRGDEQASDRQLAKFLSYVQRFAEKWRVKSGAPITFAKNYFRRSVRGGTGDPWRDDD
jgi:hypothetical protein